MIMRSSRWSRGRTVEVAQASDGRNKYAYVIGSYPVLTTTFIDRELRLLRRRGMDIDIVSIRRPQHATSPEQQALQADVEYLLPVRLLPLIRAHARFGRSAVYWSTFLELVTGPHRSLGGRVKTVMHFGEGVHAADVLADRGVRHIHAHFIDRAAIVALIAGRLLDVPFSVTAHAKDIYVDPVLLTKKVENAAFVATCTEYNRAHLAEQVPARHEEKIVRVYHGLDVRMYKQRPRPPSPEPTLLAVGQLREKKGFVHLLDAAHLLRERGYRFRVEIVGEGPQREILGRRIEELALGGTVSLLGALAHGDVVDRYQRASIFVLPCVTGSDGDRDGIPNVILEAMAMELPVVSSNHSGIPEAVVDGETGVLVPPGDPRLLTDALAGLLDDPAGARAMGCRGREVVGERFDVGVNVDLLRLRLTGVGR